MSKHSTVNVGSTNVNKVLVANRGEIAVRILRTLRTMGIPSVIVFHPADALSPAVREADEAYELSGETPVAAYLDVPQLLGACRATGADAVHPGYGFLAENARFAAAVEEAGLTFIGPRAEVIDLMGDKIRARALVSGGGFPVAPSANEEGDPKAFLKAARKVGYPLLIKAAAGGGGKGMRIVFDDAALEEQIAAAKGEAKRSFGDDRIYAERYVMQPRHIEVQVLSDQHGQHLHLWERECSVQRRFQKLIEESPSPALNAEQRKRLCETAVGIAKAVGYTNAGTVEFILAPDGEFYFLEMNTRLQVEHPVTELVTGVDLVELQIRVARGEKLALQQSQIHQQGHAIECRLCAEDADHNYAPTVGHVAALRPPAGPGVRFDGGLQPGQAITPAFDPLLAKIIVPGSDRTQAIARARHALRDLVLLGVDTNAAFLERVLGHQGFADGAIHTHFLDEHLDELLTPQPNGTLLALLVSAAALAHQGRNPEVPEPYASMGDWRN